MGKQTNFLSVEAMPTNIVATKWYKATSFKISFITSPSVNFWKDLSTIKKQKRKNIKVKKTVIKYRVLFGLYHIKVSSEINCNINYSSFC